MFAVQGLSRAKIHGDAVLHNTIAVQYLVKDFQLPAAIHHVIFRDDFKPVYDRLFLKDMGIMRNAQPNADAVILISIETICRHRKPGPNGNSKMELKK